MIKKILKYLAYNLTVLFLIFLIFLVYLDVTLSENVYVTTGFLIFLALCLICLDFNEMRKIMSPPTPWQKYDENDEGAKLLK